MLSDRGEHTEWIDRLVTVIEQLQIFNHAALDQNRKIFLPVPMLFPDGAVFLGQLLIHLPEELEQGDRTHHKESSPVRITFLLEMSHLAPLRVDFVVVDQAVSGRFLLSDESVCSLFKEHMASLEQKLAEKGFVTRQMSCLVKEASAFKETLIEENFPPGNGNIRLIA